MKKIAYLSLIAISILAGCKSNSFTKQRYTNYSHPHHKTDARPAEAVAAKPQTARKPEIPQAIPASDNKELLAYVNADMKPAYALAAPVTVNKVEMAEVNTTASHSKKPFFAGTRSFKPLVAKTGAGKVINKVTKLSKADTYKSRGLVGLALNIVLLAIVLAVAIVIAFIILALV